VFSRFFIDQPIFAAVLSIVLTVAGGVAIFLAASICSGRRA